MKKYFFLIDLDGVLIDNVAFEDHVLDEIARTIAYRRNIPQQEARSILCEQINRPVEGRNRYRYDYQCRQLGLEDEVWQKAHEKCKESIDTFDHTFKFLKELKNMGNSNVCIVSDSTRWTLDFKLEYTGLNNFIPESFSQDDTLAYKGELEYWDKIFSKHEQPFTRYKKVFYLENRIDRIRTIKRWNPSVVCILVMQSEHLEQYKSKERMGIADYEVHNLREALSAIERSTVEELSEPLLNGSSQPFFQFR